MTLESREVSPNTEFRLEEDAEDWGLEAEVPEEKVVAESDGDYELELLYGGETVARVLGDDRFAQELEEAGMAATGYSWLTGETVEEPFPGQIGEDRNYGLAAQAGNLMFYDSEGNIEQVGRTEADDGLIAYMWEERDEDTHFEERGELHMVPGEDAELRYNGMNLDV
jgi:hypothetical protein